MHVAKRTPQRIVFDVAREISCVHSLATAMCHF